MALYSIKDLERISSTKAHTIRIWEQRYNLLDPERTDTNIRIYNSTQLKKLLNVCTLLDKGLKISRISQLTKEQFAREIDHVIAESFQGDVHIEAIINTALIAINTYDTALFNELFANAVKRLGLRKTYERIIYPLLVRTGLMWIKDDLLPSQEHFLSNLIRQKLFAAIDSLPRLPEADQTWVLFLNEDEDHEIGLLFAHYLIRQYGKNVVYLGARVPYDDLFTVISQVKPTHIYSFLTIPFHDQTETLLDNLASDFQGSSVCISGGIERARKVAERNKISCIQTIEQLIEILNIKNAS
ncbi:MerR family transcriptional regulator [Dyadobacter arcticus]|uniref:DNA-binding transcriptional MerR regulator n=1 Tax=Dyadobacter arcticus TaxID=1078754 RepID=A0ABX0UTI1_9BACT|nr:MerR family transcriptional regulator [Dyadobacter arcticus]NIJ55095.1 DNA-binding transcriptional MerR regulator [Dyadobacter arcticus]